MTATTTTRARRLAAGAALALVSLAAACGTDEVASTERTPSPAAVDVTKAPTIASWTTIKGIAVPLGADDGPTSDPGRPFTGYRHNPQGAALAVIDQSVQLATAGDTEWSKVLAAVTTPGPGRDAWAGNRALVSITATDPATTPTIVGYTISNYSPESATVSVIQRYSDRSLTSSTTTAAWSGGDWKITLPTGQARDNPVTAIAAVPTGMVDLEGTRK